MIPIPADLLQTLANYLATKPWQEVNNLIVAINNAANPPETPLPSVEETPK